MRCTRCWPTGCARAPRRNGCRCLGALDIPCGPVNSLEDLLEDEYLRETRFFQQMRHPLEGDVTVTAIPARFSASPPSVRRLWPALGEHTREVLREIGCDEQEIRTIADSG